VSEGQSLTRREFDAVIRRAAELSSSDPEAAEGAPTEDELFRIAGEVGLDRYHVQRALSEVRSGSGGSAILDRIFGPASIRASRVVPATPEHLADVLDDFFVATQLLQSVRRSPEVLQYRPAVDWASQIARVASFSSRKYYLASARSIEVRLDDIGEGRTHVDFLVDPGTRNEKIGEAFGGGGVAGVGAGTVVGIGLATVAPVALAVAAGAVLGGGLLTGITFATGAGHRRKLGEVRTELEGVLDALESGRSLEPPPASWQRWVKRHFHGMARELTDRS
jgi:hypothetical protein